MTYESGMQVAAVGCSEAAGEECEDNLLIGPTKPAVLTGKDQNRKR
jgi:hypothetical protein